MNKLIFALMIFVIFVLMMGGYLLYQSEEKINVDNQVATKELKLPKKPNLNSNPEVSRTNPLESKMPLEANDLNHLTNKKDSTSNISTKTSMPPLNSDKNQIQGKANQIRANLQNNTTHELTSKKLDDIIPNEKEALIINQKSTENQLFTFEFSADNTDEAPKVIKISIPINTHQGKIGSYTYSAKLENGQFLIIWNIPGWFQNEYSDSRGIEGTYNAIKYLNLTCLEKNTSIYLSKKTPIELTFVTFDGMQIPDGTKIKSFESGSWIESYHPITMNQKGILYIELNQIREVPSLSIGQYCSESFFIDSKADAKLTRTIPLKKKKSFKITLLDKTKAPLSEHFVAITKTGRSIDFPKILEDYKKNEDNKEFIFEHFSKTDTNGTIEGETENIGEYYAFIFGPNIQNGLIKEIMVDLDSENIIIQIDIFKAELKLNFLENGNFFLGELKGNYKNNKKGGAFSTKTGSLFLNQLESGTIELHLWSKVFINSTIQITLPDSGLIEKDILLKPGSILTGVLNSNATPILGKEIGLYLYEKGNFYYGHQTITDKTGHFSFTGLNPEITYILNDISNYELDRSTPNELHSSDKEITINLIEKEYFSGLVFDENGKPIHISHVSATISHNTNEIGFGYTHYENNLFTVEVKNGDTISFCIQTKDFANHYQTVVFDPTLHINPINIIIKKGIVVNGVAFDTSNNPLVAGLIVGRIPFEYGYYFSNKVDAGQQERTALGIGGTFQIENAQIGEKYYVLSKDNSPIPFTIEEKHRHELIELKATKSYSFSGNLRSQKNILQEGRRVTGERVDSKERAEAYVDAKGIFFINCLRPGKWVFTSNFRDMYKVVPRIEIEIIDKDETYDWVVYR